MQTHVDQKNLEKDTEKYCELRECRPEDIIYSEMAAPSMGFQRLLNAEMTRLNSGLYLAWCNENIHMNEAMHQAKIAERLVAKTVLNHFVDPVDVDDLEDLMDQFPNSVIEFSVFQKYVGWAERKMVVWEVRDY